MVTAETWKELKVSRGKRAVSRSVPLPPPTYHHDYAVHPWCPYYREDVDSLKSVQRRITKMIQRVGKLLYRRKLKKLNLHSLKRQTARSFDLSS